MMLIKCAIFLMGYVLLLADIGVAADPNILETTIITETDEEISLRWVETDHFLANENLPVWLTTNYPDHPERIPDVMRLVGPFNLYHDLHKSSAVVHFLNANCIRGVIGLKYFINCLPYDQVRGHRHKIGESRYVTIVNVQELSNLANLAEPPLDKYDIYRHRMTCSSIREIKHFYPEILIFISNEIVTRVIPNGVAEPDYKVKLSTLVMQYIVQFNAVAMLFAKLQSEGQKVHINIAGLVIEKNRDHFPLINSCGNDHPSGHSVLQSMIEYIKNLKLDGQRRLFVEDSFDFFLLSTMKPWQERAVNPVGMSTWVFDILQNRRLNTAKQDKTFLGSIVDGGDLMLHYDYATREIAHLMSVNDDAPYNNLICDGVQCHTIMQDSVYRPNSLTWSRGSIQTFQSYFSWHKNACFLRNEPRSLYPFGVPVRSSTPIDQCRCYGYHSCEDTTSVDMTGGNCKKALRCKDGLTSRTNFAIPPVDGTPCSGNGMNGVCWRGQCRPTPYGTN